MNARGVLVTGGCRSGKSRYALQLAKSAARPCFLATAQAGDAEMSNRIERHRRERGPGWTTIEEPLFIARKLRGCEDQFDVVVIDCLTLWTSNWLLAFDDAERPNLSPVQFEDELGQLIGLLEQSSSRVVLVTNEVGWGVVPDNPLARRFRDLAGMVNQRLAETVDEVVLMVSGIAVPLKQLGP